MVKDEAPAQAPQEGGGEGGSPEEAVAGIASTVDEGIQMLGQIFTKIGAPPPALKKLAAISQAFQQTVGELMGGGQPQQPAPGGVDAQESGGNPNARPAQY
jgi:hypothetical protein